MLFAYCLLKDRIFIFKSQAHIQVTYKSTQTSNQERCTCMRWIYKPKRLQPASILQPGDRNWVHYASVKNREEDVGF